MSDWEIKKPLGCCSGSNKEILPGDEYFAALIETNQGLERHDYCKEYWQENHPEVFYFWKAIMPDPNQKKSIFIDDDTIMTFFNRLADEEDAEKINFRFVLCLMLMRKRRLKYVSSEVQDERELWLLNVAGEKRTTQVVNPNLREEQIEELTDNLGQILQIEISE